ncbi:MAG: EAL domain-containing protein [Pleomorphochaeta sp.]
MLSKIFNQIKNKIIVKLFFLLILFTFINIINNTYGNIGTPLDSLFLIFVFFFTYFWGIFGGIIATLIVVIVKLPFININVHFVSYFQLFIQFLVFSFLAFIFSRFISCNKQLNKYYNNNENNYLSVTDLKRHMETLIKKKTDYSLIFVNIKNYEDISVYIEKEEYERNTYNIISHIKRNLSGSEFYSYSYNKFIVLYRNKEENINLKQIFKSYIEYINNSTLINKKLIKVVIKVGIVKGLLEKTPEELIYLSRLTSDQGNTCESGVFEYDINKITKREETYKLANELSKAVKQKDLFFVYQPIINLKRKTIESCEILIRWKQKEKFISPSKFIKIAEDFGFINEITKYSIDNFISNYRYWEKNNISINQSINLSSIEIINEKFINKMNLKLKDNNIPFNKLGIELTERCCCTNNIKLQQKLSDLQTLDYRIEIDDFGTGYNSLTVINNCPFDIIKIDKSFIDNLNNNTTKIILNNLIKSIHEMGKTVIAEGVEKIDQYNELLKLKCDYVQGYFFSKPLESTQFLDFYKSFNFEKVLDKYKENK